MRICGEHPWRTAIAWGAGAIALAACTSGPPPGPPAAPAGLVASAGDARVTLTWEPVAGAAWYNLYWATVPGDARNGVRVARVSSPFVHRSLANGTSYYYVVTAQNAAGESAPSPEAHAVPSAAVGRTILVDDHGASPWDDQPDAAAIQAALDSTLSGDTVVFTSGVGTAGYRGYRIDRTLFLTGREAKHALVFTASDPTNHALLQATRELKGFVVRLFSLSRVPDPGSIDDVDFGHIDVDGGRAERICVGPNGVADGLDDNYGSWLPECAGAEHLCIAGNMAMAGEEDANDPAQDYAAHPSRWTTGVVVHDLVNRNAECGTALLLAGAKGTIRNVTIDTAGDHVHVAGCALIDDDGDPPGAWADGITSAGPAHSIVDNVVYDPSDVGIVFFGGRDTVIAGNTVRIRAGNRGAFAAIALHSWGFGNTGGTRIDGNTVVSEGDSSCGGLHAGINVGPHMWGGACVAASFTTTVGNATCELDPAPPGGAACAGRPCQVWTWIPAASNLSLSDNVVTGAHVNYLVEGVDAVGRLDESNNVSEAPRTSDWQASRSGCHGATWGPLDKVARHPTLPGWTDLRIHCER